MSPAKSSSYTVYGLEKDGKSIEDRRPSPLKINKDSHAIHKNNNPKPKPIPIPQQQMRQPVIIYTHSPKVIHTQARDFMALVQKLTGLSQTMPKETDQQGDQGVDKESNSGLISLVNLL